MSSLPKNSEMQEHTRQVARLYSGSRLGAVLDRLEQVQKRGEQFRAKCPAHDGKSSTSISITETDDGRILIYCFGGCSTQNVLDALGMEFQDLMPERITHNATPQQRRRWRQDAQHRDWLEIINEVVHELRVVWLACQQIRNGWLLSDADQQRLEQAIKRIETCGRVLND